VKDQLLSAIYLVFDIFWYFVPVEVRTT